MTTRPGLQPIWLRPIALGAITAAHVAAFAIVRSVAAPVLPSLAPIIEIAAAPEPTEELQPEPAALAEPPPEPTPEPELPDPPEAMTPPVPEPITEVLVRKVEPKPVPPKKKVVRKPEPKPSNRSETASSDRNSASEAAAEAGRAAARAAAASYAARVAAEFGRHKHYPESARAQRLQGTATLAFVIGPSGSLVSSSVVRSSGHAELDAAVRAMAAASHFPPPPGGRFASAIPVHFSVSR